MKKRILSLVLLLVMMVSVLFYFGLNTKPFEGRITEVDENGQLVVICPVQRFSSNMEDIAYACEVQTTENTIINNDNDESLAMADIERCDTVFIVLSKRHFLRRSKDSREVTAEKVTVVP